ncbi:MAG: glycoside hydrolase family 3 C-terminal domain-containing protein [Rhodoferax sp.]|nr:glycoside hydrolase family 3 C-terminal domain-containing protein [Rhodoferax sp.]
MNGLWMDTKLPAAERARLLSEAMTVRELAGQLFSDDASNWRHVLPTDDVGSLYNAKGAHLVSLAQALRARHRLNVPVLFALDCAHGHAMSENLGGTIFPSPLGMAATFDTEILRAVGRWTSQEMISTGIRWNFGPNIDVARDLRFGRIEETFGEDPYLVGELGAAMIEGMQDDPLRPRVLATAKHMTGYSEGTGARDSAECPLSWRVLRRDHIPPYRRAVQAGVWSVMSGYHAIDGVPCVINQRLLREELRTELGFKGFVVSDADNVHWCTLLQALDGQHADFIVRAVEAGNEIQLAVTGVVDALATAADTGRMDITVLRQAAALLLEAKFALGLFEEAAPQPVSQVRTTASFQAAVDVSAASMVLLENRGILPLGTTSQPQRVLLVGELANDLRQQLGCWTILCRNDQAANEIAKQADAASWTYLAALRDSAQAMGAQFAYVPGCGPAPGATAEVEEAGIAAAVAAAAHADVVIAVVGDSDHWVGEGRDRADMVLPGRQQAMLEALHATGKPLVVVLAVTKPHAVPWIQAHAAAVVCCWTGGMGGGLALAQLLWGERDFTGHTPITWPAHVGQLPLNYDRVHGAHFEGFSGGPNNSVPNAPADPSRDVNIWRIENTRHIDLPAQYVHGLWPFGHGLSYSSAMAITAADMTKPLWKIGESPRVRVQVSNPGKRDGSALVQVYVRDVAASVTRPDRRLAAWAHVPVAAGANATVELALAQDVLEVVDANGQRVTEPGHFHALVGFNSLVTGLTIVPFEVR